VAHPSAGAALLNAPDITPAKKPRDRAIIAVLLGCARCAGAKWLADGRYSGGFAPEATAAARHANTPELSVYAPCGSTRAAPM
jgi:hypothetical protein